MTRSEQGSINWHPSRNQYESDWKIHASTLSSPVSKAYLRCCDKISEVLTDVNIEAKLLAFDPCCCFAAVTSVCRICSGSPWPTTRIAHLFGKQNDEVSPKRSVRDDHKKKSGNNDLGHFVTGDILSRYLTLLS